MIDNSNNFWKQNWGYVFWGLIGFLSAVAGMFQPIANIGLLFVISGSIIIIVGGFFACGEGAPSFFVVFGFGCFLFAMYGLGFAIIQSLFGWAIFALISAMLLYAVGVIGILGLSED